MQDGFAGRLPLIFGIFVFTVLTLVVIPILYFSACRNRPRRAD